jgi:hypothetical protein
LSLGLGVLPGTALKTLRLRMEVGLATAMPRVGWTVRSPLGWMALLVQARMAPWLGSVALGWMALLMQAQMAPWLGSVALGWMAMLVQARTAPWLGSVVPWKLIEKPGAQAERWPAE